MLHTRYTQFCRLRYLQHALVAAIKTTDELCCRTSQIVLLRMMLMETRCCQKKFEFQRYPPQDFCVPLAMSTNLHKKVPTQKKKKKNTHTHIPGQMLGQDRPEKNSSQTFNSKRRDSECSTDIDRQCSQHGRWYVAGAGQASDERHIQALMCRKQTTKNLDPSPMAKKIGVFRFLRRAQDVTGKLSPPRARIHLISSRPSSAFIGLARHKAGWPWVDYMPRSKVYRRVSYFSSAC